MGRGLPLMSVAGQTPGLALHQLAGTLPTAAAPDRCDRVIAERGDSVECCCQACPSNRGS